MRPRLPCLRRLRSRPLSIAGLIASQPPEDDDTKNDDHDKGDDHLEELSHHPCLLLVKGGDALYSSVGAVHEHLAGRVVTGDVGDVFDRVIELPEPVEICSSSLIPPRAVPLFDDPKKVVRHAPES